MSTSQSEPASAELIEHINELRKRLLIALLAVVGGTLISFAIAEQLIRILAVPIGGLERLQSIDVTENVGVFMRVSLLAGFIIALPVIVFEIVAFFGPGLEKSEKRWLYAAIPGATLLFLSGVAFAYFVMLPTAIPFLTKFLGVTTVPRLSNYIGFVNNLLFWIGLSFETPLLVFLLAKIGLVTAGALLRGWRYAIVIIAVIAAFATPTVDPFSIGLLMLPLFILYLLSIVLARIAQPRE